MFRSDLSDGSTLRSRSVLCATGVTWRRLDALGIDRLLHAGVYYGSAISEAPGLTGKDVFIIGGGIGEHQRLAGGRLAPGDSRRVAAVTSRIERPPPATRLPSAPAGTVYFGPLVYRTSTPRGR
jgi:hypothetical protein